MFIFSTQRIIDHFILAHISECEFDRKKSEIVKDRFLRCASDSFPQSRQVKYIARPKEVIEFKSVHNIVLNQGENIKDNTRFGLHHYQLKSYEEFLQKKQKWSIRIMGQYYNNDYFHSRDKYANALWCDNLKGL